ncbi:HERV-H LTR-associating protein 2 isoform X2 [Colius striatus]|uniref:HERV-H LTR-associating protein 2 isoform X2 n=1 Tax=Colius striatus TaxID=57412 RepID=UPI002B1DA7F9|nr:HERV-H LTR-associating protein 2 isoform X2 [Colius striatus]XP_061859545.1 HERV-H LTR-associating protein 2 isoform X2 [Colius striatus]XP_061859556.1 HERV-H LTR-associating protein 2 isoform X2 [Colius striatus]XP_061859565.1 HERV-H LTR-associating protein 2 isoform X2 [Colius striatus]XP_061859575.1 HERV-H LTR-associating protein 2 isoform X2 [Colius striatus]
MKGQKITSLLIYLFHISATLWGFTEQETVTGLFSKDCILPCSFPPGDDEVIYWKNEDKTVHSYYYKRDQLERQDPGYRHRTYLFHEDIPNGNASLKLSNLTLTDEGAYKCYVGTKQTKTEMEVFLHIRVSSFYALEYQKTDTGRILKCYAFLTYPAPNISWEQGNTSIQETDREETRDGVLYSVRSDQNIINTADPYYCRIHLPHEEWAAKWKMQDQLSNVEGNSTTIPCEYNNNTANTDGFRVVWTLNRNAVVSVLASFNGTAHSYQPRVQINQKDFSLVLHDLTGSDSGEYLCNISTPFYTHLTMTTLQVEHSGNTVGIVLGVVAAPVVVGLCVWCCYKKRKWRL